jgi:hypothetical protein
VPADVLEQAARYGERSTFRGSGFFRVHGVQQATSCPNGPCEPGIGPETKVDKAITNTLTDEGSTAIQ